MLPTWITKPTPPKPTAKPTTRRRNPRLLAAMAAVGVVVLAGLAIPQARTLLATVTGDGEEAPTINASTLALTDIPLDILGYYITAASDACPELDWQLLAAVGKVETNHARSNAPGVTSGLNRAGCCAGPMQFNLTNGPPSTWDGVGRDYNGDGRIDVYDPADAVPAAARKLCANGIHPTPQNRRWDGVLDADPCPKVRGTPAEHRALRRYNNACWYTYQVLEIAHSYTSGHPTHPGKDAFLTTLTQHPRIHTTSQLGCDPAPDLASGNLDIRVRGLLALLAARYEIRISCLQTGHSVTVKGTDRVSNHHVWRAVDLDMVNGQPVSADSPAARELISFLDRLSGVLRPSEIGSPFPISHEPFFTDSGHKHHLHIGYDNNP